MKRFFSLLQQIKPADTVSAHCDGPCGVYDPAQARVAAEAALSMTKKILDMHIHDQNDEKEMLQYQHTMIRYTMIKEEEAENVKHHLLVLWTDYFKPEHLDAFPQLHEVFWKAAKACSAVKQEVSVAHAQELLGYVEEIHHIFWKTKGRTVEWILANG